MLNLLEDAASKITGSEYPFRPTPEQVAEWKDAGIVVVYGASDDLMEFDGAIYDEAGVFGGGAVYLGENGLLQNGCESDDCPYFKIELLSAKKIHAIWGEDNTSWTYKTDIQHEKFEIIEEGQVYCVGIVFRVSDLE